MGQWLTDQSLTYSRVEIAIGIVLSIIAWEFVGLAWRTWLEVAT